MNAIKEARYNLGIAYLNDAQYKAAISEFEAVIQLDADFIDAHCGLSCAYLELKELEKAETSALAALSLNSDYPTALSLIDDVKNSRYDNGITYLNDERYNEAVSTFQKIATSDPDFKHVHYYLGRTYIGLKEYGKAIGSLQSAIDSNTALKDVHYHLGRAYFEQRQFDKAVQNLEQAIIGDPNHKEAHYNLACAYRETGNLEASTNAATETLRLDPNYQPIRDLVELIKQTHYNRGIAYLNDERYSDAIAAFQNVIALDPDFIAAHFNLGVAYLKMETYPPAVEALRKTVILEHTHKAAYHALALAYFGQHELEKARNAAKEALKIDANFQPASSLLEAIDPNFPYLPIPPSTETQDTATQPEIEAAEDQLIEENEQARPTDNESQSAEAEEDTQGNPDIKKDLDRGLIFLNNRQYQQAAAAYKRVIKADPNCIDARYGLGEAYLEVGAFDDAKTAAEEALKLDPYHQPSHELLQTIKYFVNLERNQKIRKKVLLYTSIVVIIAFGVFVAHQYGMIPIPDFFNSANQDETDKTDETDKKKNQKPKLKPKPIPPKLSIKPSLEETSRNGFIYAGETGQLKLIISNRGGPSDNFRIQLQPTSIRGLRFKMPTETFNLSKDSSKAVIIEIIADKEAKARDTSLNIQLVGKNGSLLKTEKFDFKIMREGPEPEPVR